MMTLERQLETILATLELPAQSLSLEKMQGDASYRIYYRLKVNSGRTFIVMKMPEGKASASEEITNLQERPTEMPFVNVGRFLKSRGLPVPEILFADERAGILILEDLGDETFEKQVASASDAARTEWYRKAVTLLLDFQKKTAQADPACIAYRRSFDATLLNWEFDHFLEYGIEARLGLKIPENDAQTIRGFTGKIAAELTALPRILVHRDFQSRNLMVQNGDLRLIDFQDALMGPRPYDLVALLRDSYVALSRPLLSELVTFYAPDADFRRQFDLMTVQRKLKDAGRFVYIDRVKGNPSFLKHIPNSLQYVREAFENLPDQTPLFELLKKYVPEWRTA